MRKHQSAEVRKPEILEHYYQTVIEEGLEGASIGKIAKRMNIHPSLIIHYFKTKHKMTIDLVDLIIDKFEAPTFLDFSGINNPEKRFHRLMDVIFSKEWSKTVDSSVFTVFTISASEFRKSGNVSKPCFNGFETTWSGNSPSPENRVW